MEQNTLPFQVDHKGVTRGKCNNCSCVSYDEQKESNNCRNCACPSSKHEPKTGCIGSLACQCLEYISVSGTNDCYSCGHLAVDHKGMGRTSVEANRNLQLGRNVQFGGRKSTSCTSSAVVTAHRNVQFGLGSAGEKAKSFQGMIDQHKLKRKIQCSSSAGRSSKKGKGPKTAQNEANFRKTIKIQLKEKKMLRKGKKKTYHDVGDQTQVTFGKHTTIENVLKACASTFLNIKEEDYQDSVNQGLVLYLLDGKAIVTDPSFTHNKTSFSCCYEERSEHEDSVVSSEEDSMSEPPPSSMRSMKQSSKHHCTSSTHSSEPQQILSVAQVQHDCKNEVASSIAEISCSITKSELLEAGRSIYPFQIFNDDEVFKVLTFDVTSKNWPSLGLISLQDRELVPFSTGGMRSAFNATLAIKNANPHLRGFKVNDTVVIKKYTNEVQEQAKEKGKNIQGLAMKEVQTQMVVQHIVRQFTLCANKHACNVNLPEVISCFLLVNPTDKEVLMMEKKLEGRYVKYLNNSGIATETGLSTDDGHVCLALAHWSLEYNEGKLLLTDLQGVGLTLTDVEVATLEKGYFGIGNVGSEAITKFRTNHTCNKICQMLKLKAFAPVEQNEIPKSTFCL